MLFEFIHPPAFSAPRFQFHRIGHVHPTSCDNDTSIPSQCDYPLLTDNGYQTCLVMIDHYTVMVTTFNSRVSPPNVHHWYTSVIKLQLPVAIKQPSKKLDTSRIQWYMSDVLVHTCSFSINITCQPCLSYKADLTLFHTTMGQFCSGFT